MDVKYYEETLRKTRAGDTKKTYGFILESILTTQRIIQKNFYKT